MAKANALGTANKCCIGVGGCGTGTRCGYVESRSGTPNVTTEQIEGETVYVATTITEGKCDCTD